MTIKCKFCGKEVKNSKEYIKKEVKKEILLSSCPFCGKLFWVDKVLIN